MRWLATVRLEISRMRLPGDMGMRRAAEHVQQLAKNVSTMGVLNAPIVRAGTYQLISGHDRIAACLVAGIAALDCRVVDATDEEVERMALSENLFRRHDDQKALRSRMVELEAKRIDEDRDAANYPDNVPEIKRRPGRPKTTVVEARETVAVGAGVKPDTLRKADSRARAKEAAQAAAPADVPAEEPNEPCVATFGRNDRGARLLLEAAADIQAQVDEAARAVAAAVNPLRALVKHKAPVAALPMQAIFEAARQLANDIRALKPTSFCPFCKAIEQVRPDCTFCKGDGVVREEALRHVAPELLAAGPDAIVLHRGRHVKVSSLSNENPATEIEDADRLAF